MRKRVLVLMGGTSSEHEVSLVSGTGVVRALDPRRYNVHPVLITKDQVWKWSSRELSAYQQENFSPNYFAALEGNAANIVKTPPLSMLPDADIAFLALHGRFGEDGRIQALLEHWGIPYTGSGVLGSALAMDKIQAKYAYLASGIPTAAFRILYRRDFHGDVLMRMGEELGFPLVIKDPCGGSSLDMGIVKDLDAARELCERLFQKTNRLLCETFIVGREASCGYIEDLEPLPPTEIRMTTHEYFDYEAKYQGASREITPAEFERELIEEIQNLARRAHEALNCQVYSRTDVRVDPQGRVFVLETNTLPGMTPQSLLPQQAACIGLSYAQLIDAIIERSLRVARQ